MLRPRPPAPATGPGLLRSASPSGQLPRPFLWKAVGQLARSVDLAAAVHNRWQGRGAAAGLWGAAGAANHNLLCIYVGVQRCACVLLSPGLDEPSGASRHGASQPPTAPHGSARASWSAPGSRVSGGQGGGREALKHNLLMQSPQAWLLLGLHQQPACLQRHADSCPASKPQRLLSGQGCMIGRISRWCRCPPSRLRMKGSRQPAAPCPFRVPASWLVGSMWRLHGPAGSDSRSLDPSPWPAALWGRAGCSTGLLHLPSPQGSRRGRQAALATNCQLRRTTQQGR